MLVQVWLLLCLLLFMLLLVVLVLLLLLAWLRHVHLHLHLHVHLFHYTHNFIIKRSKKLEEDRERRSQLPNRGSLPSSWYKEVRDVFIGVGVIRV